MCVHSSSTNDLGYEHTSEQHQTQLWVQKYGTDIAFSILGENSFKVFLSKMGIEQEIHVKWYDLLTRGLSKI